MIHAYEGSYVRWSRSATSDKQRQALLIQLKNVLINVTMIWKTNRMSLEGMYRLAWVRGCMVRGAWVRGCASSMYVLFTFLPHSNSEYHHHPIRHGL